MKGEKEMYIPTSQEEKDFLQNYDAGKYEKPSVTADIVVFTLSENNDLSLLLIKRGGFPYKGKWAIPGGFAEMKESLEETAARELREETGLSGLPIIQFGTFSDVDRDPRMRVISVAYMAFVPKNLLKFAAGDDAADAKLFTISIGLDGITFVNGDERVKASDLAFDHEKIIITAIERLRNRIDYKEDAFNFLKNDQSFTIYELKKIFETVNGKVMDAANFRRDFMRKYVNTGVVVATGDTTMDNGHRAAALYRKVKKG